jgi:hypothetical protein
VSREEFEEIIKEERWGEPDGPELEIQLPILPSGKVVVRGRDIWGLTVPTPPVSRALRINSLIPEPGEKYRIVITWSGGPQWRISQKKSRRRGTPGR